MLRVSEVRLTTWSAEGEGSVTVVPDAEADVMWWRGELWVAGFDTVAHEFSDSHGEITYGVRLPAGSLAAVLRDSAAIVRDQRVRLSDVVDAPTASHLHHIVESSDSKRRALLAATTQILDSLRVDDSTNRAARMLVNASAKGLRTSHIARELGWSPRRLHRFCVEQFGVSPVMLRQVHRFRRAHHLLAAGTAPAEVASSARYSDQAHLTRDFVRFAGVTPGHLHTRSSSAAV
jgi:AraC-like DNA-binding protein